MNSIQTPIWYEYRIPDTIIACCVLHNICVLRGDELDVDDGDDDDSDDGDDDDDLIVQRTLSTKHLRYARSNGYR